MSQLSSHTSTVVTASSSLFSNMKPAPINGGLRDKDYWIWCPTVLSDDSGTYHMFSSRWPHGCSFSPHWLTNSEVIHATSTTPEGPYQFEQVVLPPRGNHYWDGCMTHNPTVRRAKDGTWLLFYTGTCYEGERPTVAKPAQNQDPGCISDEKTHDTRVIQARKNQRIGLATAPSPYGPWTRSEVPIVSPRPGRWDAFMATNPAPCLMPDDSVLLIYKSAKDHQDRLHLGALRADHYTGPYHRVSEEPILQFDNGGHIEDPFIWREDGRFRMLIKDMTGSISGCERGGIEGESEDGIIWKLTRRGYNREIQWSDGSKTLQNFVERPSLILDAQGKPSHFCAATAIGSNLVQGITESWNMVIPLS